MSQWAKYECCEASLEINGIVRECEYEDGHKGMHGIELLWDEDGNTHI